MNILYSLPYFNPKRGGDVNICTNLAKEFVKKGHKVTILTTEFELDMDYVNHIKAQGVNIVYIKSLINLGLFIYSPDIKKWLNKNIKNFDIIHLHTFRAYQNNIIQKYSKKYNIPYIMQPHGSMHQFLKLQNIKKIYDFFWGNKILKNSAKIIVLNKMEKEENKSKLDSEFDKIKIIPNGIDLSPFKVLPKKGLFKQRLKINDEDKIILFLGRIHPIKGIKLLLNSFYRLNQLENNRTKLIIAGPDEGYLSEVKKLVEKLNLEDNIIFTGFLDGEEKLSAYFDADVYVLPSIYELFPVTILEALACGTKVIVTDRCGIADLVSSIGGYVVPYEEEALKEALIESLNNDNYIEKSQINYFDMKNIANKIEKLYLECTGA